MPEEETQCKIFLNDTLPVEQERLLVTLPVLQLVDYGEMSGNKATPTRRKTIKEQQEEKRRKKAKLVVKEHHMDTTTKQWSTWTTGPKKKKTPKRHSEQNMLERSLGC